MEVLRCVNGLVEAAKNGKSLDDVPKPDLSHCDGDYDFKVAWVIGNLMAFCSRYEILKTTVGEMNDIVNYKE